MITIEPCANQINNNKSEFRITKFLQINPTKFSIIFSSVDVFILFSHREFYNLLRKQISSAVSLTLLSLIQYISIDMQFKFKIFKNQYRKNKNCF